jgi:hypothetical protein
MLACISESFPFLQVFSQQSAEMRVSLLVKWAKEPQRNGVIFGKPKTVAGYKLLLGEPIKHRPQFLLDQRILAITQVPVGGERAVGIYDVFVRVVRLLGVGYVSTRTHPISPLILSQFMPELPKKFSEQSFLIFDQVHNSLSQTVPQMWHLCISPKHQ